MKHTRRYSYANFGTFWGPPGINAQNSSLYTC